MMVKRKRKWVPRANCGRHAGMPEWEKMRSNGAGVAQPHDKPRMVMMLNLQPPEKSSSKFSHTQQS